MPTVPPKTINDLPRDVRKEFERLAFERSVLGYAFSFERLVKLLSSTGLSREEATTHLEACIVAWKEDEAKKLKESIGDKITNIYTENGIDKTLRYLDPFDRPKDYIMAEGTAVSMSQNKAIELGVAGIYRWKCPVCEKLVFTVSSRPKTPCPTTELDPKTQKEIPCEGRLSPTNKTLKEFAWDGQALKALFDLATTRTKYVGLQARDVKEGNGR